MGGPPSAPNPNAAAIAGQTAAVENFPFEDIINQLAQLGQSATINGTTYNFAGLGNADQAAITGQQTAAGELALQQQYGPQFIQSALAQVQAANPLGTAAENQLGNLVSQPLPGPSATSNALETNVLQQLANEGLTTGPMSETEQVQQGVRGQQIANGIILGNAPVGQEASALEGAASQQRGNIQQAAQAYLQSGVSPEDVAYRQLQQQLANEGAFWAGQTPLSQFGSLSGAQGGAAPEGTNYSQPAGINLNAGVLGQEQANQIYSGNVNWYQQQMNPYLAGLSTLGPGFSLASSLGGNPFLNASNIYAGSAAAYASAGSNPYTGFVPSGATDTGEGPIP